MRVLDGGSAAVKTRIMTKRKTYSRSGRYVPQERALIGIEFATAAAAVGGGVLLALRPDGAFLHADPVVLRSTPFSTWRAPGLLLAAGCGGGFALAGLLHLRRHKAARLVSLAAGTALMGLEAWEIAFIEYQPLEVVFAGIGAVVVVLALRLPPSEPAPRRAGFPMPGRAGFPASERAGFP